MPMAYKVRTNTLPLLPKGEADIQILHFSDLHLTPGRKGLIKDIKSGEFEYQLPPLAEAAGYWCVLCMP